MIKPKTYFIFTFGCQMNKSDSERVAGDYQARGYREAKTVDEADEVVINTCSIRKSAEDRARSLLNNLAKKFREAKRKLKIILTGCMIHHGEEKLLKMFLGRLGVSMTSMEDLRGLFAHPEICKSTAGMQNLIADIANKSEITLMVFSDSILPLAKSVSGGVLALYPRLSPDRVFISSVLKSSKMGGDAYAKILEQFGNPDPQTVLFVDDKLTYSSAARIKFNMRGFTFEGDAAKGEASAQRLKRELASAQIL